MTEVVQVQQAEDIAYADEMLSVALAQPDVLALQWFLQHAVAVPEERVRTSWGRPGTVVDSTVLADVLRRVHAALANTAPEQRTDALRATPASIVLSLSRGTIQCLARMLDELPQPTNADFEAIAAEAGLTYASDVVYQFNDAYTRLAQVQICLYVNLVRRGDVYEGTLGDALSLLDAIVPAWGALWFTTARSRLDKAHFRDLLNQSWSGDAWTPPVRLEWHVSAHEVGALSSAEVAALIHTHGLHVADLHLLSLSGLAGAWCDDSQDLRDVAVVINRALTADDLIPTW